MTKIIKEVTFKVIKDLQQGGEREISLAEMTLKL
jgi:hypothetical protein